MKKGFLSATLLFLCTLFPASIIAQTQGDETGQVYVVKNGDGLYKLSRKFFGNLTGVRKIVKAHNEKASVDERFSAIDLNTQLELGQLLWIPKPLETAQTPASTATEQTPQEEPKKEVVKIPPKPQQQTTRPRPPQPVPETSSKVSTTVSKEIERARAKEAAGVQVSSDEATIVDVPRSNCDIRVWYNYQVVAIGRLNERWKANGMSLLDRAKRAYQLRHNARVNGRYMMKDRFEVATLRDRDNKKYGNPDGPTFDYLVNYHRESGFSGDEIYERIIESSARTSPVFNSECQ